MARWRLLEPDAEVVSGLAREAEVEPLCARVLANRGVVPGRAAVFLAPSLATIGTPDEEVWGVAAGRVARAVKNGERIGVFGDYDTDGITSAAVLFLALSQYTENVTVGLPTRQTGYGLREPYVRDLFAEGVDLRITAGLRHLQPGGGRVASALGMEVRTDHHIPPRPAGRGVAVLDRAWDLRTPGRGLCRLEVRVALARRARRRRCRKRLGRLPTLSRWVRRRHAPSR